LGALTVPAVGFGAMVLSPGMYGAVDEDRAERALSAALDAGSTFVDTSDGYGPDGHNERLVGRAVRSRRDEVVLATKFGFRLPDGAEAHRFQVGYGFGELAVNAHPSLVRGYAEQSLRELGTDRIDLYYPHFPDPQVPLADTVGAVADLVQDGLVRHLGLSNVTAAQLREAHAVHPVAAVQVEWSMWRPVEPDLLAAARELDVGLVAWSPLGGGFLTGSVTSVGDGDFRQHAPGSPPARSNATTTVTPRSARSPATSGSSPASSRSRGSSRRTPPSSRSRAAAPPPTSPRTSTPPGSCCTPTPLPGSTRPSQRSAPKARPSC
jgi:aryl-alcohol dehydrogenase-like predicted oxidoreductase